MEIGLIIVLAIVIVEVFLSGTFTPFYFTVGLSLFQRQVTCSPTASGLPSTDQLERATSSGAFTGIAFRQLDESHYAFRERVFGGLFKLNYTPIMHGLLEFDHDNGQVRVTGFANWFPIAFVALFALNPPMSDAGIFATFLSGLIVLIYVIQARRFAQVAPTAVAHWQAGAGEPLITDASSSSRLLGSVGTVWRILAFSAIAVVLVPMALMLIGAICGAAFPRLYPGARNDSDRPVPLRCGSLGER